MTNRAGWTWEDVAAHNRKLFGGPQPAEPEVLPDEAAKDVPESLIEAECTKILEEDDWRALRTDPVSDRRRGKGFGEVGMADHLYIRYCPRVAAGYTGLKADSVLWVEFKSAKGKPKKHQLLWHQKERSRGALTWIAGVDFPASVEGFREHYAKSGLMRRDKWWK